MLEEKRVAALGRIEDTNAKGALKRDEHQCDGQDWSSENHENGSSIVRPDKERKPEPGHPRGAHAVRSHNEIQPGKDGAETCNKDTHRRGDDVGIEVMRAQRGGEGPA